MAKPEISIDIDARDDFVDARDFETVLKETIEALNSLARAALQEGRRHRHRWKITAASLKSPLHVTLTDESPDGVAGETAVHAFITGLQQLDLETLATEPPALFNESALVSTRRLISVMKRDVRAMTISSPEAGHVRPSLHVLENIEELIGAKFRAFGALEGILETLTVKGRTQFKLWDPVTGERITCYIPADRLEEAKNAFPHRVSVYGEIRYDKHGKPLSIEVDVIRILRPQKDLPQSRDLEGIDITSGEDPSEYIRRLRDDE